MRSVRVLIGDDNEEVRKLVARVLDKEFEVVGSVADGESLVRAALQAMPDVVVSDLSMPRLGGIEAWLKLERRGHHVPFVFITAETEISAYVQAVAATYVHKSDILGELNAALRSALAGRPFQSARYRSRA
jgi:two-component system invasion response regulator UvrY